MSIPNTNDRSLRPPALKLFLNSGTLRDLPEDCPLAGLSVPQQYEAIRTAAFVGLQDGDKSACSQLGLERCGSGRINQPSELEALVESHLSEGLLATTLHVGWGNESDAEIDRLLSKIIETASAYRYPLYLETHRATITQDNWRTVQFTKRFPDIRFNGDFSHWYTGHEMVYGDWEEKLSFIQPVLERVRFLHGRIASPGSIQAPLTRYPEPDYVEHFRQLWRLCFEGFLKTAQPGDTLIFAPELLPPSIYYAQTYADAAGNMREHSDRWTDALALAKIAEEEFENARKNTA
ncbi:hypothetical protein [Pelagicoccus sp. SDUM812005]|uniref:hypothetical protein n=1 Tax=Pelagicoccus sp. SDUM812005 TaxID=3041257 RepID=UPI00280C4AD6|nr:hypothetical protein [Pelagicoccus sp. SDUM812005]MDQ8183118.1 hypothetical protein [Pelagicoccus sp. SDUM812005]